MPARPSVLSSQPSRIFRCWGTARLRLLFLGPLASAVVIIVLSLSALLYHQEQKKMQQGVMQIDASARQFYEESVRYDAQALQAVMHVLERDVKLREDLARRDRMALLMDAKPLFEDFRRDFNITHFYFTGADRVNILRVHAPLRFGDVINRITMLQAEHSGSTAYGVELGPLGTFTLRLVSPWYDRQTNNLIGYVELGMEIDRVLNKLEDFFQLQVITTVYKKFLQREKWERGMRAMGRTPHWELLPDVVVSKQSMKDIPAFMVGHLEDGMDRQINASMKLEHNGQTYQVIHLPLHDAGGRVVAQMILLADVSNEASKIRETILIGCVAMVGAGATLFVFFFWLTGKIGERIEHDEKVLENMATHDGLTGLLNHQTCYSVLEDEIKRSIRYQRMISLLILDIDHFKEVNDTYGHRAGDMVLHKLSGLLLDEVRDTDHVCRYGGEEFVLILPETDSKTAMEVAGRLRNTIEMHRFYSGEGEWLTITVSIGVAVYPLGINTKESLVAAADAAMYQAKQEGRNRVCLHPSALAPETGYEASA